MKKASASSEEEESSRLSSTLLPRECSTNSFLNGSYVFDEENLDEYIDKEVKDHLAKGKRKFDNEHNVDDSLSMSMEKKDISMPSGDKDKGKASQDDRLKHSSILSLRNPANEDIVSGFSTKHNRMEARNLCNFYRVEEEKKVQVDGIDLTSSELENDKSEETKGSLQETKLRHTIGRGLGTELSLKLCSTFPKQNVSTFDSNDDDNDNDEATIIQMREEDMLPSQRFYLKLKREREEREKAIHSELYDGLDLESNSVGVKREHENDGEEEKVERGTNEIEPESQIQTISTSDVVGASRKCNNKLLAELEKKSSSLDSDFLRKVTRNIKSKIALDPNEEVDEERDDDKNGRNEKMNEDLIRGDEDITVTSTSTSSPHFSSIHDKNRHMEGKDLVSINSVSTMSTTNPTSPTLSSTSYSTTSSKTHHVKWAKMTIPEGEQLGANVEDIITDESKARFGIDTQTPSKHVDNIQDNSQIIISALSQYYEEKLENVHKMLCEKDAENRLLKSQVEFLVNEVSKHESQEVMTTINGPRDRCKRKTREDDIYNITTAATSSATTVSNNVYNNNNDNSNTSVNSSSSSSSKRGNIIVTKNTNHNDEESKVCRENAELVDRETVSSRKEEKNVDELASIPREMDSFDAAVIGIALKNWTVSNFWGGPSSADTEEKGQEKASNKVTKVSNANSTSFEDMIQEVNENEISPPRQKRPRLLSTSSASSWCNDLSVPSIKTQHSLSNIISSDFCVPEQGENEDKMSTFEKEEEFHNHQSLFTPSLRPFSSSFSHNTFYAFAFLFTIGMAPILNMLSSFQFHFTSHIPTDSSSYIKAPQPFNIKNMNPNIDYGKVAPFLHSTSNLINHNYNPVVSVVDYHNVSNGLADNMMIYPSIYSWLEDIPSLDFGQDLQSSPKQQGGQKQSITNNFKFQSLPSFRREKPRDLKSYRTKADGADVDFASSRKNPAMKSTVGGSVNRKDGKGKSLGNSYELVGTDFAYSAMPLDAPLTLPTLPSPFDYLEVPSAPSSHSGPMSSSSFEEENPEVGRKKKSFGDVEATLKTLIVRSPVLATKIQQYFYVDRLNKLEELLKKQHLKRLHAEQEKEEDNSKSTDFHEDIREHSNKNEVKSEKIKSSNALVPFHKEKENWSTMNEDSYQDWLALDKEYLNYYYKSSADSFSSDTGIYNLNNLFNPNLRGGGGNAYSLFHQQLEKEIIEEFLKVIQKERMERLKLGMAIETYSTSLTAATTSTSDYDRQSNFENEDQFHDTNTMKYTADQILKQTAYGKKSTSQKTNILKNTKKLEPTNTDFEETPPKNERDIIPFDENLLVQYV